MSHKFIHCDCDCFFAAIEIRDDPTLSDLPVAVGGPADSRGVIATCNYVARRSGVHSAMPSARARRLCPDLLILPPNMEKYRLASRQIQDIFADYTALIEPLSLDEAYLDVSDAPLWRSSATLIARDIRRRVREEVGITVSAGVAPNKFLAKIASDWRKPDGLFVITPAMVPDFVKTLAVRRLPGVGRVTAARLETQGITTCEDLQALSLVELIESFGKFGERLHGLCRGVDERGINVEREAKSISVECTFERDLQSLEQCLDCLPSLLRQLEARMGRAADFAVDKCFVKLRFHDFVTTTVEARASRPALEAFRELCRTGFLRGQRPVRLLGVGIRLREAAAARQQQLSLDWSASPQAEGCL